MLNKKLLAETLTGISEIIGKPLTEAVIKIYYTALQNMTDEQFKRATEHIITTRKFTSMPLPAEWLEHVMPDKTASTIEAWQKIENAMARVGAYQTVIFDDPLIHGFIQGFEGGWPGLCSKTLDELIWVRKDFERYYQAINPTNISVTPLIGISEGDNMSAGREHKEQQIYIGDKVRAQALLEGTREVNRIRKQLEG